ncbi:hypothetical protein ABFS83_06G080600 [Erythranthe nasuta]
MRRDRSQAASPLRRLLRRFQSLEAGFRPAVKEIPNGTTGQRRSKTVKNRRREKQKRDLLVYRNAQEQTPSPIALDSGTEKPDAMPTSNTARANKSKSGGS